MSKQGVRATVRETESQGRRARLLSANTFSVKTRGLALPLKYYRIEVPTKSTLAVRPCLPLVEKLVLGGIRQLMRRRLGGGTRTPFLVQSFAS